MKMQLFEYFSYQAAGVEDNMNISLSLATQFQ